jgi:hypothetical protein
MAREMQACCKTFGGIAVVVRRNVAEQGGFAPSGPRGWKTQVVRLPPETGHECPVCAAHGREGRFSDMRDGGFQQPPSAAGWG